MAREVEGQDLNESLEDLSSRVLYDFHKSLHNSINNKDLFTIYYGNGGDTLDIVTLIQEDDKIIENKIYSNEIKILRKYKNKVDLNFSVVPRYSEPVKRFIPPDYKRYRIASA